MKEYLSYEERLRGAGTVQCGEEKVQSEDLIKVYKYLKVWCKEEPKLFSVEPSGRTRGYGYKLQLEVLSEHHETVFYCEGEQSNGTSCPEMFWSLPSLDIFKSHM